MKGSRLIDPVQFSSPPKGGVRCLSNNFRRSGAFWRVDSLLVLPSSYSFSYTSHSWSFGQTVVTHCTPSSVGETGTGTVTESGLFDSKITPGDSNLTQNSPSFHLKWGAMGSMESLVTTLWRSSGDRPRTFKLAGKGPLVGGREWGETKFPIRLQRLLVAEVHLSDFPWLRVSFHPV